MQSQNSSINLNNASITGGSCTAFGFSGLNNNTSGSANTAAGKKALFINTSGTQNTAIGLNALYSNNGDQNVAVGSECLHMNSTGDHNVGIGANALYNNIKNANVAMGLNAGMNSDEDLNTAFGSGADFSSGTSYASAIGHDALPSRSNVMQLGDPNVTNLEGTPTSISVLSDGRFKTNVNEKDVKGLDFILRLKVVDYEFRSRNVMEILTSGMSKKRRDYYLKKDYTAGDKEIRCGFIAQDVEKAALAAGYNFDGIHKPENEHDTYSLAYGQFVVPLVKAVQEQEMLIDEIQNQINKNIFIKHDRFNEKENFIKSNLQGDFESILATISKDHEDAYLGIYDLAGYQIKKVVLDSTTKELKPSNLDLISGEYLLCLIKAGEIEASTELIIK